MQPARPRLPPCMHAAARSGSGHCLPACAPSRACLCHPQLLIGAELRAGAMQVWWCSSSCCPLWPRLTCGSRAPSCLAPSSHGRHVSLAPSCRNVTLHSAYAQCTKSACTSSTQQPTDRNRPLLQSQIASPTTPNSSSSACSCRSTPSPALTCACLHPAAAAAAGRQGQLHATISAKQVPTAML